MDTNFDVLVLGTGLIESITAAALAKAGIKVIHVDTNPYYGGDEAGLTVDELKSWAGSVISGSSVGTPFSSASFVGEPPCPSRSYALSLFPSLIVSTGPFITSLIRSGVARYGGYKLLERAFVFSSSGLKAIPGSKQDIFKSKELSLMNKRKLMRFLHFASGEFELSTEISTRENWLFSRFLKDVFSLDDELVATLACALALCDDENAPLLPTLKRIRQYLRSSGRYGPSPFLVALYGGIGELSQGFCRICAVSGGTYILGRKILSIDESSVDNEIAHRIVLEGLPDSLTARLIIMSPTYLLSKGMASEHNSTQGPSSTEESHSAHCIAIIDGPVSLTPNNYTDMQEVADQSDFHSCDSALLVYPPGSFGGGSAKAAVRVYINGEGSMACPSGKCVLYLTSVSDASSSDHSQPPAERLLRPYVDKTCSLLRMPDGSHPKENFAVFFTRSTQSFSAAFLNSLEDRRVFITPSIPAHITDAGDAAAIHAEKLFRRALKRLCSQEIEFEELWPPLDAAAVDDDI